MEVQHTIREFTYNGVALPDPGAQFSIEQVREFFSALYPDIVNAAIEGPKNVGNKLVYEFRRAVGTKGATIGERVEAIIQRNRDSRRAIVFPKRLRALHGKVGSCVATDPYLEHVRRAPVVEEAVLPAYDTLPVLP